MFIVAKYVCARSLLLISFSGTFRLSGSRSGYLFAQAFSQYLSICRDMSFTVPFKESTFQFNQAAYIRATQFMNVLFTDKWKFKFQTRKFF